MNVTIKDWFDGEPRVSSAGERGIWIECEVSSPPSREGQTVHLFISPEQVDKLLLEFRSNAIYRRRATLTKT